MKIHQRLIILAVISIGLIAIVSGLGYWEIRSYSSSAPALDGAPLFPIVAIIAIIASVAAFQIMGRGIYLATTNVISDLNSATNDISISASDILAASESLASGSATASASLEQASASLEELSSMTNQAFKNTEGATRVVEETEHVVIEVTGFMTDLMKAMKEIKSATQETGKVIQKINDVAVNTNLLALNAAVEAARAGEAGAGFAVVAEEVRSLAANSAQAAKDTADLIETTIRTVQKGADLVVRTDKSFVKMAESMGRVNKTFQEIFHAAREQALGLDQINIAVADMDKVTRQVAMRAEQLAESSETMNLQAEQMRTVLADFVTVRHATQEEVVKFVHEGVEFARQYGKDAFIKEVMNRQGRFIRGELYMFVYDYDVRCLAHGFQPHLVGKNLSDRDYMSNLRDAASRGGGWVAYDYENPVTKKRDRKVSYSARIDDRIWCGSGTYLV